MTRTIDEYLKEVAKHKPPARVRSHTDVRPVAQDVVRMDALTGDESWDYFLRYIEAGLRAANAHSEFLKAKLCDPYLAPGEEMQTRRVAMSAVMARIEVLTEILMLPKRIRENGELAAKLIAEMEFDTT